MNRFYEGEDKKALLVFKLYWTLTYIRFCDYWMFFNFWFCLFCFFLITLGIMSSAVVSNISAIAVGITKYKSIIKKKLKNMTK